LEFLGDEPIATISESNNGESFLWDFLGFYICEAQGNRGRGYGNPDLERPALQAPLKAAPWALNGVADQPMPNYEKVRLHLAYSQQIA